jgi:hypothetical protein
MQKFMCLVWFDDTSFAGITEEEGKALTDATIEEDRQLREEGRLLIGQPLQGPETSVDVTTRAGRMTRTDGPYMESKEWLGGFTLILAEDMDDAVRIAAMGEIPKRARIEIRPTLEQTHSVTGEGRPEAREKP